jgi:RNA polymerase sigma-70 factor (ECF subfamily)
LDGSTSADITRLVAEHHAVVYRAAYRLSGSTADAEDLAQQTFLTAHRSLAQLRDERAALGWLMAILRSCFLKMCRKRRPLAADDLDLDSCAAEVPEESEVDPERLQHALDELSPEARVMLTMFYFDDLSYREIAAATEIPIGTVMSRLSRAKEQLRRKLTAAESEEAVAKPTEPKPTEPSPLEPQPDKPKRRPAMNARS